MVSAPLAFAVPTETITYVRSEVEVIQVPNVPGLDAEEYLLITKHFEPQDVETFIKIASCESNLRQFTSNGNVLRGHVHAPDMGIAQINSRVWQKDADRLGYDLETLEGNIQMARYVKDKQGWNAWVCKARNTS